MKISFIGRCLWLPALFFALPAPGATVNLTLSADAFVSSANPTLNYGGAGSLAVSAAGLPNGEFDSLLQFDSSQATSVFDSMFGAGQWQINSITLQFSAMAPNNTIFNGNGAGPGDTNVNFAGQFTMRWMQNDSWIEGTGMPITPTTDGVTFSTLSSYEGANDETVGTFSSTAATSGNVTRTLPLTPSFLADATAGNEVSLLMLPADSGVSYLVNSRSFNNSAMRPVLAITASAVPEPGAGALLAGAACMWLLPRRRYARAA